MMAVELLPCPLCGSPAELTHHSDHHGDWFNLGCSRHWLAMDPDEACPLGTVWYTEDPAKEADAVRLWNERASSPELSALQQIAKEMAGWLGQFLDAYDNDNVEMNSPEIGGDDDIPLHPWHEEWLHHSRTALARYHEHCGNG